MLREIILGIGVIGLIILILIVLCLPLICTIVLGTYFATALGLTGIVWWAFVIIFYIVLMGAIGTLMRQ